MGMFFWLIVLFAIAWGVLDWELGVLRDRQQAQETSRPIAKSPAKEVETGPRAKTPTAETEAAEPAASPAPVEVESAPLPTEPPPKE